MGSTLRRTCTRPARRRCGRRASALPAPCAACTRSATTTNAIRPPLTSSTTPASPCTPVSVPVLARTRPRAVGRPLVEAVLQRAGEAGDRQAGEHLRAARAGAGCSASRSTPARRVGAEPVAGGRARCRRTAGRRSRVRRAAAAPSRTDAAPAAKEPSCRSARPTWRASTSAAWLSLTSRVRSTISPSGALETEATSSASGGRRRARRPADAPSARCAAARSGRSAPPSAAGSATKPKPVGSSPWSTQSAADRRYDVLGDVGGRPGRVDRRPGEVGVVEGEPDPASRSSRAACGRRAGRGSARPARSGSRRRPPCGRAGEERVAAADQHELARSSATQRTVVRKRAIGPERLQRGRRGEQLGRRGGGDRRRARAVDRPSRWSGRSPARRSAGPSTRLRSSGLDGGGHLAPGRPPTACARPRRPPARAGGGQAQALGRLYGGRLGPRVGRVPSRTSARRGRSA